MPLKGRPRLTQEQLQDRIDDYCRRYDVRANAQGLPPFPAGQRETPQHREWIAVYKAHQRLGRRSRGECERCAAPVEEGSIFCQAHRGGASGPPKAARSRGPAPPGLPALLEAQQGRCPVCRQPLSRRDGAWDPGPDGTGRGVLHERCRQLVDLAEQLGADAADGLRGYLRGGRRSRR